LLRAEGGEEVKEIETTKGRKERRRVHQKEGSKGRWKGMLEKETALMQSLQGNTDESSNKSRASSFGDFSCVNNKTKVKG
jgi:hypothetical protein